MRTPIWIALALTLLFGAAPVAAGELSWDPVKLKAKAQKALIDCRSVTLRHEAHVACGTEWETAGYTFVFTARSDGTYAAQIQDSEGKKKNRSLGAKPGLIPIDAFGVKYALAWRPAASGDALWVASAYGVELKLPGGTAYFVDSNRNGKLGELGDGYVAPECRTVAPWTGEVWTLEGAWMARLRKDADGWEKSDYPMPYDEDADTKLTDDELEDHAKAWRLLQWRRQQCGLLTLGYKKSLETPMRAHIVYCRLNKYQGDEQDEGKEGYTPEGAVAAKQAVFGFGAKSHFEGMQQRLATLYHRNGLLQPGLTDTAIVLNFGVFAANIRHSAKGSFGKGVLLYPPHGMQNVALNFNKSGESPMPTANQQAQLHNLGTAIGLYSTALESVESLSEKPKLKVMALVGAKRKPGRIFRRNIKYPGNSPNSDVPASNFGTIAIVPGEPLEKKTTYLCQAKVMLPDAVRVTVPNDKPFVYEWEFTTTK